MQPGSAPALLTRMSCRREKLGWEGFAGRLVSRAADVEACNAGRESVSKEALVHGRLRRKSALGA